MWKLMSLTKRLSESNKFKCTRNKWIFEEQNVEAVNLNKIKPIKLIFAYIVHTIRV